MMEKKNKKLRNCTTNGCRDKRKERKKKNTGCDGDGGGGPEDYYFALAMNSLTEPVLAS
jgi:hypothetical protein